MTVIDRDGERVAALVHDPSLGDEPELLGGRHRGGRRSRSRTRACRSSCGRASRSCGARARAWSRPASSERQRLERNLHDGAQQRLVALSLELGLLEQRVAADPEAGASIERARREIAASLEELREIARGLHPAVVSGHGLAVALEQLAAGAAVPVQLDVELGGRRLPEPLEVAAYYLVCESLANIGKHARATSATVDVRRRDGEVTVEVVDDGVGGADTERGSGLRGLADRVEALGGRLRVWSPRGGGTRVQGGDPVRVAIAEDSVLLREGLARLLGDAGCEVVAAVRQRRRAAAAGRAPWRRTSPSSTSGCRRPTPTRGCAPRWRSARSTPPSASWCCPSTSSWAWR